MSVKVGKIGIYDVLYIPEKDIIFCKNTTIKYPLIRKIIKSSLDRTEIPEKELVIIKDNNIIHLGCLTTTLENCENISREIRKYKI